MRNRNRAIVLLCAIVLVLPGRVTSAQTEPGTAGGKENADTGPQPKELLRNAAQYLADLPALRCELVLEYHIEAAGMNQDVSSRTDIRIQRPSRMAYILQEGRMGATIVSDGEQLLQYVPMLSRYTVEDAPADLTQMDSSVIGSMIGGGFDILAFLGGDKLYDEWIENVSSAKYLGMQEYDGVDCHHSRFIQDDYDWELWIEAGDKPIIRKLSMDMTKQLAKAGADNEMFKDAKVEYYLLFNDWDTSPDFSDEDFQYTPPESASLVDSLLEGAGEGRDAGPHPLLGKEAPTFVTEDLDQEEIDLDVHLGEDVVVLDFWATWCGPCVDALPVVSKTVAEFEDQGVVFYAVNIREDVETIREFLEAEELSIPVALDPEGEFGSLYQANAIPQTVLIGKDRRVQVVHVGFGSGADEQLKEELEALIAGEDLATEALAEAEANQEQELELETEGLEVAWSVPGKWSAVCVDHQQDRLLAVDNSGHVAILDTDGNVQDEIELQQSSNQIRTARLVGGQEAEFVVFRGWGEDVRALAEDGAELWSYVEGEGVNDVWPADLDGDGLDEIVIGYNGSTGIHVLDNRGNLLWKYTDIGNVWHVAAADFNGDGELNVLTTSAQGKLHVFQADGTPVEDFQPSVYATMVRAAPTAGPDQPSLAIVGGTSEDGEKLIAMNHHGEEQWGVGLPGAEHVDSLSIDASGRWAAVGMRGGMVYVVDLSNGSIRGQFVGDGLAPMATWTKVEDMPLVLLANGKGLHALKMTGDGPAESE